MGWSSIEGFIPGHNKYNNPVPQDCDNVKGCQCGRVLINGNDPILYSSNQRFTKDSICIKCEGCSQNTRKENKNGN